MADGKRLFNVVRMTGLHEGKLNVFGFTENGLVGATLMTDEAIALHDVLGQMLATTADRLTVEVS